MPKRRQLHFASLDDVGREAETLMKSGYQRVGHWTLGTLADHLGKALVYSCEGFPRLSAATGPTDLPHLFLKKLLSREQTRWRFPAPISVDLHVADPDGVASLLDGIKRSNGKDPEVATPGAGRAVRASSGCNSTSGIVNTT